MGAAWLGTFFKGLYTVVSAGATVGAAVACGPCAPAVAGLFALGGVIMDGARNANAEAERKAHEQLMRKQLEKLLESIDRNKALIEENGHKIDQNGQKIDQNGQKIDENGQKIDQNGQKIDRNGQKIDELNEMLQGLRAMMNTTAEENRETLRDIQLTLKTFEENMNRNFQDLKLFMVEKDFNREIMLPMQMIWKSIQSATTKKTTTSMDRFLLDYTANPPRRILSKFVVGLGVPHSNPIISAMEHDVIKSRRIMDNYMHLLTHLIFKVLAVEGFYFGVSDLPKNESINYMDELSNDIDDAIRTFQAFTTSYKLPIEKYWPDAVNRTLTSTGNDKTGIEAKADAITQALDGILTSDVFSIFVYPCPNGNTNAPYPLLQRGEPSGVLETSSHFMVERQNPTDFAVVLRSERFHDTPEQTAAIVQSSFSTYAALKPTHEPFVPTMSDPFLEVLKAHWQIDNVNGFVAYNATPVVRFTNNGTLIVAETDLHLMPIYYGLTWA